MPRGPHLGSYSETTTHNLSRMGLFDQIGSRGDELEPLIEFQGPRLQY